MKNLRPALLGSAILTLPLVPLAVAASTIAGPADSRVIINLLIAIALVVALQTFVGNTGIVSFGHVAFMGIGAYTTALLTIPEATKQLQVPHLPGVMAHAELGLLPAVLIGALVSAVAAAVIGGVLSRMDEAATPLATIGVLVAVFVVFDNWTAVTRGPEGLFGVPESTTSWIALGSAAVAIAAAKLYRGSSPGLRLRASAEDAVAAEALGVNVIRLRFGSWIISAALMGFGGGIWAGFNLAFSSSAFFFDQTFTLLAMLVVGGLYGVSGAVSGAVIITVATEIVRRSTTSAGAVPICVSLTILAVLYLRPEGLIGRRELDEWLLARIRRGRHPEEAHAATSGRDYVLESDQGIKREPADVAGPEGDQN